MFMTFAELYEVLDPDMYVCIYYEGVLNAVFEGTIQDFYDTEYLSYAEDENPPCVTVIKLSYDEFETNALAIHLDLH